ncbi:hypothetical protein UPYG_G00001840 [Umbra pygmaea]|uniref:Uncharacterized protein n=1 Tax=Umbra pygmaea TaxID=75934 RepID=A0ABD0XVL9_UMBPY
MEFFNDSVINEADLRDRGFQNNFSGGYNDTDAFLPTSIRVTIVVVYMIVCVVGLVGNCLVMYVIISQVICRLARSSTLRQELLL